MFLASVVQLNSSSDEAANWEAVRELVDRASGYGAQLVATPENTNFLGPHEEKVRRAETLDGRTCRRFSDLSRKHRLYLLLGSFNEKASEPGRCFNTSVLFGPNGGQVAVYRKIHLFDVDVSPEVRFAESKTVEPGSEIVIGSTPLAELGLSVCYDLRFAELYRSLVVKGANVLTVPSAFTLTTGKDHWHALVRARAIETQCYLLAPAQVGKHDDEGLRESYGHSMIVDPWGHVIAMASDGPGLALAEIDLRSIERIRKGMPILEHRRI